MNTEARNRTTKPTRRGMRRLVTPACLIETRPVGHSTDTLESLKNRLLNERLGAETDMELIGRLRRAADDSASLAWASPFPLLTLPELLAEKALEAERQYERQAAIQTRGRSVLSLAA